MLKRDQDQAKPDPDPPEVSRAGHAAAPEHEDADQDEQERDARDVEREHLDDHGGADIRPEHHSQRRDEVDKAAGGKPRDHKTRGRAALQYRRYTQTRQECFEPAAEGVAQDAPQLRAERARDPGLDHVHAPDQQRNGTGEVHQGQGCAHPAHSVPDTVMPLPLIRLGRRQWHKGIRLTSLLGLATEPLPTVPQPHTTVSFLAASCPSAALLTGKQFDVRIVTEASVARLSGDLDKHSDTGQTSDEIIGGRVGDPEQSTILLIETIGCSNRYSST